MKILIAGTLVLALVAAVVGGQSVTSTGPGPNVTCDQSAVVAIAAAATTQIIPLVAGKAVFVCGYLTTVQGAATPQTVKFVYGTGTNCATGQVALTGAMKGSVSVGVPIVLASAPGLGTSFRTPTAQAICITTTTADPVDGHVAFAQF